jgi:hypothetical protein
LLKAIITWYRQNRHDPEVGSVFPVAQKDCDACTRRTGNDHFAPKSAQVTLFSTLARTWSLPALSGD